MLESNPLASNSMGLPVHKELAGGTCSSAQGRPQNENKIDLSEESLTVQKTNLHMELKGYI